LLLASIPIFSTSQGNSRYYGHFSELVVWIFVLQKSVGVSGKGKFDGMSKKFGLSLNFVKAHEK
jgi:hypothetical protein